MGKRIIQQARGKGSPTYKSPSFRFVGKPIHPQLKDSTGTIAHFIHCQGHTAPLAHVVYEDKSEGIIIASEGLSVGQKIAVADKAEAKQGNIMPLKNIPEGALIHNIEQVPGDGGKFVRASGTFAKVVGKKGDKIVVMLPSKKTKEFNAQCRASIGVIAGGGRTDKPFLKAGTRFFKMKARNKLYPKVCGISMNAVDHPFGGCHSTHKRTSSKYFPLTATDNP